MLSLSKRLCVPYFTFTVDITQSLVEYLKKMFHTCSLVSILLIDIISINIYVCKLLYYSTFRTKKAFFLYDHNYGSA